MDDPLINRHSYSHFPHATNFHYSHRADNRDSQSLYTNIPNLNNEWMDVVNNSPLSSKSPMSATQVISNTKFVTPKLKSKFHYITPLSDKQKYDVVIDTQQEDGESSVELEKQPRVSVSDWDIFWKIINTVLGKDKLAKVSQYSLKLLIYHADVSQKYLSDDKLNITSIKTNYTTSDLLNNFIKFPRLFVRAIAILLCSLVGTNLSGMVSGLGMYRQFLRFGKSPFKLKTLVNKLRTNITYTDTLKFNKSLFTASSLSDFTSLYYCVNDELGLLYKLHFYSNKSVQQFAARHEALAWYYETLIALYTTWNSLSDLSQQEMDVKILIQVKNKARMLSKQLLGNTNISFNTSSSQSEKVSVDDLKNLKDLQFKKKNAWIDIYKNLSDLMFNTYTVFKLPLPFDTMQIWMGISASVLSTIKIYRETKKKMIEEELAKLKG